MNLRVVTERAAALGVDGHVCELQLVLLRFAERKAHARTHAPTHPRAHTHTRTAGTNARAHTHTHTHTSSSWFLRASPSAMSRAPSFAASLLFPLPPPDLPPCPTLLRLAMRCPSRAASACDRSLPSQAFSAPARAPGLASLPQRGSAPPDIEPSGRGRGRGGLPAADCGRPQAIRAVEEHARAVTRGRAARDRGAVPHPPSALDVGCKDPLGVAAAPPSAGLALSRTGSSLWISSLELRRQGTEAPSCQARNRSGMPPRGSGKGGLCGAGLDCGGPARGGKRRRRGEPATPGFDWSRLDAGCGAGLRAALCRNIRQIQVRAGATRTAGVMPSSGGPRRVLYLHIHISFHMTYPRGSLDPNLQPTCTDLWIAPQVIQDCHDLAPFFFARFSTRVRRSRAQ